MPNCPPYLSNILAVPIAAAAVFALAAVVRAEPVPPPKPKIIAYVPNWIDLKAFSATLPYEKLTHINIAFENPINDAGDLSFSTQNDVLIAAAHAKGVKVLISIGGGSASGDKALLARYFALIGEKKRAAFAAKLADYVVQHKFDGLDVDIEGPSINEDYGAFIQELARALKPKGKLLTSALSKGYGGDKVPSSVFRQFDFVNIMAYDGTGPWDKNRPGQHSSLEFAQSNVDYWVGRGLPKSKAVLGVPFYGYGFGDAFKTRDYPYATILASFPNAEKTDQV
ncbi:MAG: glycosyl hydrolase family 18 protein, partial [Armatimonadota bacterium]